MNESKYVTKDKYNIVKKELDKSQKEYKKLFKASERAIEDYNKLRDFTLEIRKENHQFLKFIFHVAQTNFIIDNSRITLEKTRNQFSGIIKKAISIITKSTIKTGVKKQ